MPAAVADCLSTAGTSHSLEVEGARKAVIDCCLLIAHTRGKFEVHRIRACVPGGGVGARVRARRAWLVSGKPGGSRALRRHRMAQRHCMTL